MPGGATRQDSVRNGLEALARHSADVVLVHDAARPVIPPGTVADLARGAAERTRAPSRRARRGHAEAGGGRADRRDGAAGRPVPGADAAGIPFSDCCCGCTGKARRAGATDDASLLEAAGHAVRLVPGSEDNMKMTYPEDSVRVERVAGATMVPRVGTGFDVHVLRPGGR